MDPELVGEDFHFPLLRKPAGSRGRPEVVSRKQLERTFVNLLFIVSQYWATVGWELRQATEVIQIRNAFKSITGINFSGLELYRREGTIPGTALEIAKGRAKLERLSQELYDAHQGARNQEDLAERAQSAIQSTQSAIEMEQLRPLAAAQVRKYDAATEACRSLSAGTEALRDRLECQKAHVAQEQLLKFILSNRRALTPKQFAAAMAGLPFISWRQSSERCAEFARTQRDYLDYEKFLVIAQICATSPSKSPALLADHAKAYLCGPTRDRQLAHQQFRDDWYFLEHAIHSAFEQGIPCEEKLPFLIHREYQARSGAPTVADQLRRAANRL